MRHIQIGSYHSSTHPKNNCHSTVMSKITEKGLNANVILQRESDRGGGRGHGVGQSHKVTNIKGIRNCLKLCRKIDYQAYMP